MVAGESPEAGLKACSWSLVRERLEWGEVATEDMTAEEAGDCSGRTDMGAIPPPGYMQPSL